MPLSPDFDQRMSALRARVNAMRESAWKPEVRIVRIGKIYGPADLISAGVVAIVVLAVLASGLL